MPELFDFDAFLAAGIAKLTGYCAAIVGPADAEDVAQEAYLSLWRTRGTIPNEAAASSYLYRAAYHIALDLIKSRRRMRIPDRPAAESDALSEKMVNALCALSPEDRAIVYGRVVDECGYGELAARFGKSEAWARKRYSLARKRLASLLASAKDKKEEIP